MKKVLIITYYWPPGSGSGVQRFLKFTKYLNSFGWQPVVLTVKNGNFPSIDESLEDEISSDTIIYRAKSFEPFYWYNLLFSRDRKKSTVGSIGIGRKSLLEKFALFVRANYFIPDARIGWNRSAFKTAKQIISEHQIDAVISTGPPQSSHLIGEKIKNTYNIPWVVDLRDPWTTVYYNDFFPRSRRTKLKDKKLEDRIVSKADALTVVSEGLYREFESRNSNISLIYNGFDESDFNDKVIKSDKFFKISYVGNFLSNQNVEKFWLSLSNLVVENPLFADKLVIELVGNIDSAVESSLAKNNLEKYITKVGFVNHQQAVNYMMSSDLLLFVIPDSQENEKIITGKLFEYLATGNDIISFGPVNGDASNILKSLDYPPMLDYNNQKGIEQSILKSFNSIKSNKQTLPKIKKYSRYNLTEKLSVLLNSL